MHRNLLHIARLATSVALLGVASFFGMKACRQPVHEPAVHIRDYNEIVSSGVLRVAAEYNSISFYVENDTLAGFDYDLIQAFARDKGLKVDIIPEMSFAARLQGLEEGRFDLIANGIQVTSELKDSLAFTLPITKNRQVLVQRKASPKTDSLYVHNPLELAGRTLHVTQGSPSIHRIKNLSNEIGDTIYIREIDKYSAEQLISLVAHGDIDYAVCDEKIAQAASDSLPQIDISTAISFNQFYSWALNPESPQLLDSLNHWLSTFQKSKTYRKIYRKYH